MLLTAGTKPTRARRKYNPGEIIQSMQHNDFSYYPSITSSIPYDNTIPLNGEGAKITDICRTLTPKLRGSRLRVRIRGLLAADAATVFVAAVFRVEPALVDYEITTFTDARVATLGYITTGSVFVPFYIEHEEATNTMKKVGFQLYLGVTAGRTLYMNGDPVNIPGGVKSETSMVIEEIAPYTPYQYI